MDSNLYGHKTAEFFWVAQCLLGTIRAIVVIRIASFLSHANVKPIHISYTLEQKPHIHFLPCSNLFWLVFR